ncbi:hypothetical protein ZHAS_00021852 [Anopheles sinensis]|uniref:Uncharacterized protein n=1 Tax=Anopheles sinensis TaxID=74873 RepID=A0A084WTR8_ANOSI|nr:hypothetical protein ZHAS_00021852 [Anopheles sinensis]
MVPQNVQRTSGRTITGDVPTLIYVIGADGWRRTTRDERRWSARSCTSRGIHLLGAGRSSTTPRSLSAPIVISVTLEKTSHYQRLFAKLG